MHASRAHFSSQNAPRKIFSRRLARISGRKMHRGKFVTARGRIFGRKREKSKTDPSAKCNFIRCLFPQGVNGKCVQIQILHAYLKFNLSP